MKPDDILLQQLGPLPLSGAAWPAWIKALAWFVLVIIGVKLMHTAASTSGQAAKPAVTASITLTFAALLIIARYMQVSVTQITAAGIEQSWLTRRAVGWDEIQFAKFIPLIASKRLICFTGRGRPVVFQAGTRELQIAFAQIALAYPRRSI